MSQKNSIFEPKFTTTMKKKFLSITIAAAVASALNVSAQTFVKEMNGADARFIPGQYMKNGEAAIYFSDDEYGYKDGGTNYTAEIGRAHV